MKKVFGLAITAIVCFSGLGQASAADLPYKKVYAPPPFVEVAVPYWSGFYAGGNVGYGWGKDNLGAAGFNVNGVAIPGTTSASLKPQGILGGLQAGYNYQFSPYLVAGVEADFQWANQKSNSSANGAIASTSCFGDPNPPCNLTGAGTGNLAASIDWFGTVRGRLGLAIDKTMLYGTGGLAYGRVKTAGTASFNGTFTDNSGGTCDQGGAGCPASGSASFGDSRMKYGWAAGAGVERSVGRGFMNNWTWKVEYLYVDLGAANSTAAYTSNVSVPGKPLSQTVTGNSSFGGSVTDQIVRIGTNYKFGG